MLFYMLLVVLFMRIEFIHSSQLLSTGVSCTEKRLILRTHNEMRLKLAKGIVRSQPKASNMMYLVWDDQLENLAQSWANNMYFAHNENRRHDEFYVGENIFTSWSTSRDTSPDWSKALQDWFNEHVYYRYGTQFSHQAGHYTQLVWAETTKVGCGFSLYRQNGYLHKLYVCNYGPGGNILGRYPYKTGAGCENLCCNSYCSRPYGNQCS